MCLTDIRWSSEDLGQQALHLSRKTMLSESPRPHSTQGDLGPQSGWGWTQVTQHFLLYSEKFVLEFFRETQQEIQRSMHRLIGDSYRSQVMEENQQNSFGVMSPNTQEPRELMVDVQVRKQ